MPNENELPFLCTSSLYINGVVIGLDASFHTTLHDDISPTGMEDIFSHFFGGGLFGGGGGFGGSRRPRKGQDMVHRLK